MARPGASDGFNAQQAASIGANARFCAAQKESDSD
jgi:hypothetical protein